jgi:hypothetical protein
MENRQKAVYFHLFYPKVTHAKSTKCHIFENLGKKADRFTINPEGLVLHLKILTPLRVT